jgi:poly(3-hydroxybutyrate) depolymerase
MQHTAALDVRHDEFTCPQDSCWCRASFQSPSIALRREIHYTTARNRNTGENQDLFLDEYVPPVVGSGLRPAIIILHGGGWKPNKFNFKRGPTFTRLAMALARRGYVAVSIDYRSENDGSMNLLKIEDPVDDARAAVRFLVRNAHRLRIDTGRIAAFGASAGGLTVAAMAYMRPHPSSPLGNISCSVSLSGALARMEEAPRGGLAAGPESPPYMDFHGAMDPLVPYRCSAKKCWASALDTKSWLDARGARDYLVTMPGQRHVPWSQFERDNYKDIFFGFLFSSLHLDELACPNDADVVRSLSLSGSPELRTWWI